MNNSIWAAGESFDIGCRVIKWDEPEGLSLYPYKKFTSRNITFDKLKDQIDSFTLHHSVTWTAKQTYTALVQRGLSVNFAIEDDCDENGYATVYQFLDCKDAGWSQDPMNQRGPGVEICYQPVAWTKVDYYSESNRKKYNVPKHDIVRSTVHGQTFKTFAPTKAQVNSCVALMWGLCSLFPKINYFFPRDSKGNISTTVVKNPSGLLLHSNITRNKIDALGLDQKAMEKELHSLIAFGR